MLSLKEVYERIIDLSLKVYKGEVDPLDIDLADFIKYIIEADVENLPIDLMYLDINALYGLALILEAQSRVIKEKTSGLYIDKILAKLNLVKMSISELSNVLRLSWRPNAEASFIDIESINRALIYFKSRIMIKFIPPEKVSKEFKPIQYYIEERVSEHMGRLYNELVESAGFNWIDYYEFIERGDKIFRAYILSFLITSGYVQMKVDRIRKKILIKACEKPIEFRNPVSIPVVFRHVGGKED
ncbi:hypothetical protein DRN84_00730 [Candidatus Geothermarchaeota archaeon]|nr:MAG: hypothetical protein DRN84_00730 [Candidatus Geothermarchaeota archaeon]